MNFKHYKNNNMQYFYLLLFSCVFSQGDLDVNLTLKEFQDHHIYSGESCNNYPLFDVTKFIATVRTSVRVLECIKVGFRYIADISLKMYLNMATTSLDSYVFNNACNAQLSLAIVVLVMSFLT